MSSDVLKVKYRRELDSLSFYDKENLSFDRESLILWLFEWYESKGRKLPFDKNEKKVDEIPIEELIFLYKVLKELPSNFPMIRYSLLWSKWLLPNVKPTVSKDYIDLWTSIMSLMEERYPGIFVNDIELLIMNVCEYLNSSDPLRNELCYILLKLIRKLICIYIKPKKGFDLVIKNLWESLRTYYMRKMNFKSFDIKIIQEIEKIIQTVVSEKHISSFISILKNEVIIKINKENRNSKQIYSNYTYKLYNILFGKNNHSDCFIPLIIKKISEIENSDKDDSSNIGNEYLIFYLYININLEHEKEFFEKIVYVNECFSFFFEKNTFNVRESIDDYGNNFKKKIYESIFIKISLCIKQGNLNPHIWNCIENCILINPIKCLEFLPCIFSINNKNILINKEANGYMSGITRTMLNFISGTEISTLTSNYSKEITNSSITSCIRVYIITFTKLHDLPSFFDCLTQVLSCEIHYTDLEIYDNIFSNYEVLKVIKDIVYSALPNQTPQILSAFLGFLKSNSKNILLHEYISNIWLGILMTTIPLCESSVPVIEEIVKEIHCYIKNCNSKENCFNSKSLIYTTSAVGIIHLIRKLISWNIKERDDLIEIMNYHYKTILNKNQDFINDKSINYSNFYIILVEFIIYITKLRDSEKQQIEQIEQIFNYYYELINFDNFNISKEYKIIITKILTKYIILNISNYNNIEKYMKIHNEKVNDKNFDLFIRSIFEYLILNNDISNSLLQNIINIPYLPIFLLKKTLHMFNKFSLKLNKDETNIKKRKISDNSFFDININLNNIIDFWNQKIIVTYFINKKKPLDDQIITLIFDLYYNILFENYLMLSFNYDIEKVVSGILFWINIESEIESNTFLNQFSKIFFDNNNNISNYLNIILNMRINIDIVKKLTLILKKIIIYMSNNGIDLKKIDQILLKQLDNLNWWYWMSIGNNFDLLSKDQTWNVKIQFCTDLFSDLSFKFIKKKIIDNIEIMDNLNYLKCKLNKNKKLELLYLISICELFVKINNNIQNWNINYNNNETENLEYSTIIKIKIILDKLNDIIENIQNSCKSDDQFQLLKNEIFLLLDLIVSYLELIINTICDLMLKIKKEKDLLSQYFEDLKYLYSFLSLIFQKVFKINLEFGIYKESYLNSNFKPISEWNRYFVKCILEGNIMKSEDFNHFIHIKRHMKLYEMFSKLTTNSITNLLNHILNEILNNSNSIKENNIWLTLTYIDIFWSIVKNKGYIYRFLSPCLKKSVYSKISNWGPSHYLEFNIEVLLIKLFQIIENNTTFQDNYFIYTFSFIRFSNIISILYSCCINCYIMYIQNKTKITFNNNKILSISNILLTISIKLSYLSSNINFKNLNNIVKQQILDEKNQESFWLSLYESLIIPPYIPLYTLFNPLWDQSNRKKNKHNSTGHIDVWISQFHLIEESLKYLIYLGDVILQQPFGLKSYIQHFKQITRLYPLIVSQITKNKVQRYSMSLICDLINYINLLNKKLNQNDYNEETRDIINLNIQIIKNSCLIPILNTIDHHCKQSLFTMLKDEQRIIFKQLNKNNHIESN